MSPHSPSTVTPDPHGFGDLVEQLRPVCEDAVDDLDIAVALEAAGLNDIAAAERYGVSGVLQLAGELMHRIPTRVHSSSAERPMPKIAYTRLLCRGVLYSLPGLFYLVLAREGSARSATLYLIIAMLSGWAISQLIAVVAYRMLARTGPHNVNRMLRRFLVATSLGALIGLVGVFRFGPIAPVTIALAQILYVLAATVLLFHGADKLLALVLTPSAGVSLIFLTHWPIRISGPIALGAIVLVVPAVLVAAFVASSRVSSDAADMGGKPYQPALASELAQAVPFAVYGLLSGVIVAYRPLWIAITKPHHLDSALDITILPLVLSMGYAEIELLWLRTAGQRVMDRTNSMAEYRAGVRRLLLWTEIRFAAVVILLSVAVGTGMHFGEGLSNDSIVRLGAYLAAGCAFVAGLILSAVDQVKSALRGFALTGVVVALLAAACAYLHRWPPPDPAFLSICVVLFACLWWTALRTLRNPVYLA